ncbi:EcsC family protein [Bacillus sp. BRMEA1]|uniref:EcsC family protein n=1 Tax=Neobacillus endophyticus TaxID=2738405 RepID=UPI001563BDB6|nr:EcsC family protein [Neobacillus endophyticus]NRD77591.1 EcsC family protein [Neobacillus endophyticus]
MESIDELQRELAIIEKWEKDQRKIWFWERIGRLPFKLLDKLTPQFIHNKIGTLLEEIGVYIQSGGKYLVNKNKLYKVIETETKMSIRTSSDVKGIPLYSMEKISKEVVARRTRFAAFQGATTGIGGIFTLAIDIPALLTVSLKTLQEISIIHGYDPDEKSERVFIIKCLQFSLADVVGKRAILNELSSFNYGRSRSDKLFSQIQGWREVVYTYREQFGWKKLFQMVPVAGVVFGAATNKAMMTNLSEACMMFYRKRVILERLEKMKEVKEY